MLKKLKNLGKKPIKPLYYKKSKAAKEDEENYDLYESEDVPKPKKYKHSPSRIKKGLRHRRENEYTNYYDKNGGKLEGLPQQKRYKHSPPRNKNSSRYNKQYENTDYIDEYVGESEALPQQKPHKHSPSRNKNSSRYNKEYENTDYIDEYVGESEALPQQKPHKHSPSRIKKSSRYNRESEYTDYDDVFACNQHSSDYDKQIYDSGDETIEYVTEGGSKYIRNPGRARKYYNREETEYFDDSDSDYTSEYPSEYQREDIPAPRHRSMHSQILRKRRVVPSETEVETSPYEQKIKNRSRNRRSYRQEYEEEEFDSSYHDYFDTNVRGNPNHRNLHEVYLARAPVGHKAFTLKHQRELEEQTSESGSEIDLDDDEGWQEEDIDKPEWSKNQSRYQVFPANTGEKQGVFQQQSSQNPNETLLSVTDYDKSVPMVALRNTSVTKAKDDSQTIVYLPVVVMDNTIQLPHSKVMNAESILRTVRDKAEKPLETNMNIYLATENGQGNIFQQAQNTGTFSGQETTTPKNIQVFVAQSTHAIPVNKKPSMISNVASKIKSKTKSGYPVQKSYINVAPSKTKPVVQKGSKISIKSSESKTSVNSSLLEEDKPKSLKEKKERKTKQKNKSTDSSSGIISVINPTPIDNQPDEQRTNTSTKGDMHKQRSIQRNASQTFKKKPIGEHAGVSTTNLTKQSTFDRHVPLLKQPTLDKSGESHVKNVQSQLNVLDRQCSTGKGSKIITIKDVNNGQYEESKNNFEHSMTDPQPQTGGLEAALPKKQSFVGSIFHKKDSKVTKSNQSKDHTPKCDPYTFNMDEYTSPTSSLATVQRNTSKENIRKPKKSPSGKKIKTKRSYVEFSNRMEKFQFWTVLSYNSYVFTYIYRVMEYFLGLSIHGTLMEIFRNSKHSD